MDCYVGEIRMWTCPRIPDGWHLCDGSILDVATYEVLFALIGTTYGGNGISNFGLPNLQGRLVVGEGTGMGLTPRMLGATGGSEKVVVTVAQTPNHTHTISATTTVGTTNTPLNNVWANAGTTLKPYSSDATTLTTMNAAALSTTGSNEPHNNVMPSLGMNFIIALQGTFPSPD